jgi:hypothetical protein
MRFLENIFLCFFTLSNIDNNNNNKIIDINVSEK